jgi:p-cumate 2,3-dioxygenase ferredoxin component
MQNMTLVKLFPADELDEGEMRQAHLSDDHSIAVYRVGGKFYATDDRCTHGDVSLTEEGSLSGCEIQCSWHFGSFDIRNGAPIAMPCEIPLKTYPVHIEDGVLYVEA